MLKNPKAESLPHVALWCRKLKGDGSFGSFFRRDVGITDLGLLQVGTIWEGGTCKAQLAFEEREFDVDFTPGKWQFNSQNAHFARLGKELIPSKDHPLRYPNTDRSELLEFQTADGKTLLVPCLEFYSRFYGRSGHVARVLATYKWSDAEKRLYLPFEYPPTPGHWPIKLASSTYNTDAVFLAHVKYDLYATLAAKCIYSQLETQYTKQRGMAYPQVPTWFKGPVKLLVQGCELDDKRFLALRITGGSEPEGPEVDAFRENPGMADEPASDGAPLTRWQGGRNLRLDDPGHIVNLTPDDEPDRDGRIVEILNPEFRVVGQKRKVVRHKSAKATTRSRKADAREDSEQYSPGERYGSARGTGFASIHTQLALESKGAVWDVWNALMYLRTASPDLVTAVGWYSPDQSRFVLDVEATTPHLAALLPYDEAEKKLLPATAARWVFKDASQTEQRGVLVALVRTPSQSACLFEVERRRIKPRPKNGNEDEKEESYCGLALVPPLDKPAKDWIAEVLAGIRKECGVMERVINHFPYQARDYRRSNSVTDEVAGHSTVVNALEKVDILIPRPRPKKVR